MIHGRGRGEAVTPRHLAGAAGSEGTGAGGCRRTLAGTIECLTWTVPWPRLKGVGWTDSLHGYCSVTTIPRAVNDDVSFLLPWTVRVGWAGSGTVLWSRTVQVAGALSGAVTGTKPPSVVLVNMEFTVGARVPLLSLLLLLHTTVHLPVSPQLLLKLLDCQRKLFKRQRKLITITILL